jgi:uncharacterized membrane protein
MSARGETLNVPAEELKAFRDIPVDILRGLAIAMMVMANMAPALLMSPAPDWFRVVSSIAAPLFITIAGMMVALSYTGKGRSFAYIAIRGGLIILVGALIQIVVYQTIPFVDVDVLYLIGLSLPIAWLYLCLPEKGRWIIIVAILLATPLLWAGIGYNQEIAEPVFTLAGSQIHVTPPVPGLGDVVKRWLIDGWFPVFPWTALALIGAEIGMYRWKGGRVREFRAGHEGRYATLLLAGGAILWVLVPGVHLVRDGYVELFYPPVPGLLLFVAGVLLFTFIVLDRVPTMYSWLDPLRAAGECSLFIYILHLAVINWIIAPRDILLPVTGYLLVYLALLAAMIVVAYLLRSIRKNWCHQPFIIRFLIGG